jgi:CheY-like chemotaxis protein
MPLMNDLSVLLVGDMDEAQGLRVDDFRQEIERYAVCEHVADLPAALQLVGGGEPFQLIVLAEARPGEISSAGIDELRQTAPLARVWRLLGSWCEGEARSGHPPQGCLRSYWHQWRERFAREAVAAREGRCPVWGLPSTVTADERILAESRGSIKGRAGLVFISASRNESASALADACRAGGYETMIVRHPEPIVPRDAAPAALVWDTTIERACDPRQVRLMRRAAADAPLLAVAGFPRPEDRKRAIEAGASAVISKPFAVADLWWSLDELITRGNGRTDA